MKLIAALLIVGLTAAATAAQEGPVYRPGRGVAMPVVVTQVRAYHTPEAIRRQLEGVVRLDVVVEADGKVGDVTVVASLDREYGLDQQAIDAVRQWTFTPGTYQGRPVAVAIAVQLRFSLV